MKLLFYPFTIFVGILIFITCSKENLSLYEQTEEYCADNMIFSCKDETLGEVYFKGKINGERFCISSPNDNYWYYNGIGVNSTSSISNPTNSSNVVGTSTFFDFSISPPIYDNVIGISKDFSPRVNISTPWISDTIIHPDTYYLDEFVKEGNLQLKTSANDGSSGWNFKINWSCVLLPGYSHYKNIDEQVVPTIAKHISPSGHPQDDPIFKISDMEIERVGNISTYYITFQIECDLYYEGLYHNNEFYGRLEDGEFKTKLVLEN
jgi:hypothetical protein